MIQIANVYPYIVPQSESINHSFAHWSEIRSFKIM